MTKIEWHTPGEKRFEAGVDRGVFYSKNEERTGYPWHGLTDIVVAPEGASLEPVYVDGIVRAFDVSPGRFKATLECFEYPEEFGVEVLGEDLVGTHPGLMATNQEIGNFDLSYRTGVGDDINGSLSAYKIHLVYDAIALPSEKQYTTVSDSTEPMTNSFDVEAVPQILAGKLPTAHFIIDTRDLPRKIIEDLERILYGDEVSEARMIDVDEVQAIVEQEPPITATNLALNPSFEKVRDTPHTVFENMAIGPFGQMSPALESGFILNAPDSSFVSTVANNEVLIDQMFFPRYLTRVWSGIPDSTSDPNSTFDDYTTVFSFTGQGDPVSMSASRDWVFSYYCRGETSVPESYLRVQYYLSDGSLSLTEMLPAPAIDTEWQKVSWVVRRPVSSTLTVRVYHVIPVASISVGKTIHGAGLQVTSGSKTLWPFAGGAVSENSDFNANWSATPDLSTTLATTLTPEGLTSSSILALAVSSTNYATDRERSLRIIPLYSMPSASSVTVASFGSTQTWTNLQDGHTYRVSVDYMAPEPWVATDPVGELYRGIIFHTLANTTIAPVEDLPGVTQRLSLDITIPIGNSWTLYLGNGEAKDGGDVYFDRLSIIELDVARPLPSIEYFDGETRINPWAYGEWAGLPEVSPSLFRSFDDL